MAALSIIGWQSTTPNKSSQRPALHRPSHRGRQKALVAQRASPRDHRPNHRPAPGGLPAYERHCKELHDQFRPKNKLEIQLTQTLAGLSWRLNRISAIETNLLTLGINENSNSVDTENDQAHTAIAMAKTVREQSQLLANITLYEHRLSGRFDKALKQLRELQAERLARGSSDLYHSARILQMHKNKKVPYNPMDDGFVFSNADLETHIQRPNRKNQAYAATG